MIKKVIQISDIHIPNIEDDKPFSELIDELVKQILISLNGFSKDEVRIVLNGDIFDFKNKTSPEANSMFYKLLNYLDKIAKTIIIAGNHDMLENNKKRKDAISPVFEISNAYTNTYYIDKILNYKSGFIEDENIIWVLYSIWDKFYGVNIDEIKKEHPNKKIIGLFHGEVIGSKNFNGRISESGIDSHKFIGCDVVMAGHIHKRQELKKNGVRIVYAGSLFQMNEGETITNHGFLNWNIEDMTYSCVDIKNEYSIYKFKISSYEDIYEDKERLINL